MSEINLNNSDWNSQTVHVSDQELYAVIPSGSHLQRRLKDDSSPKKLQLTFDECSLWYLENSYMSYASEGPHLWLWGGIQLIWL